MPAQRYVRTEYLRSAGLVTRRVEENGWVTLSGINWLQSMSVDAEHSLLGDVLPQQRRSPVGLYLVEGPHGRWFMSPEQFEADYVVYSDNPFEYTEGTPAYDVLVNARDLLLSTPTGADGNDRRIGEAIGLIHGLLLASKPRPPAN